ncbi:MAG TPA: hypothetical protein VIR60_04430 [Gammaproteobacteria bacterium]
MKMNHRITLSTAVLATGLVVNFPAQASLILTFSNSAGHALPIDHSPCGSIAWTAGAEFRLCNTTGKLEGGGPYQKSVITGGEQWIFNDAGIMSGVSGTPMNVGTVNDPNSAAPTPGTNPSLQQDFGFFGPTNFLAPVQGSLAAAAYGAGMFIGGVPAEADDVPFINIPVLEWQWVGAGHPLGQASGGVVFYGDITNVVASLDGNTVAFDFHLHASEYIDSAEDPNNTGVAGFWTLQWELQGQGVYTSPVPLPAGAWLFASGLMALAGIVRAKSA